MTAIRKAQDDVSGYRNSTVGICKTCRNTRALKDCWDLLDSKLMAWNCLERNCMNCQFIQGTRQVCQHVGTLGLPCTWVLSAVSRQGIKQLAFHRSGEQEYQAYSFASFYHLSDSIHGPLSGISFCFFGWRMKTRGRLNSLPSSLPQSPCNFKQHTDSVVHISHVNVCCLMLMFWH